MSSAPSATGSSPVRTINQVPRQQNAAGVVQPEHDQGSIMLMSEKSDHSVSEDNGRTDITITVCRTKQGRGVHFCSHPILSGSNCNLWFPLSESEDLFTGIERILTMNGYAENVVRLTRLRGDLSYDDYTVTCNRKQPD